MPAKILFVNACVNRSKSRTMRLARALLSKARNAEIEELVLEEMDDLQPLDSVRLAERESAISEGRTSDPALEMAMKLASADAVVMASPYWEGSYNSLLKLFIENASVVGVTFRYSEDGTPVPLCRAKVLYYVTTRGGPIDDDGDLGVLSMRSLGRLFGMECRVLSAEALDMPYTDVDEALEKAIESIPADPFDA